MYIPLVIFILINFIACGQKSFPNYDDDEEQREEEMGYYRANFNSLNAGYTGGAHGYVVVWANERQFYARVSLQTSSPDVMHYQYIHQGNECPDRRADDNHDGKIDFEELMKFSGRPLIPLDQDLSTASAGFDWFPSSNSNGRYVYSRASAYARTMEDLRKHGGKPNKDFINLNPHEEISLDQRIVVIYGSASDPFIPMACAELDVDPNPEISTLRSRR